MGCPKATTANLEFPPPGTGGPSALAMMNGQFKCSIFQTSFPNLNALLKALVQCFISQGPGAGGTGALHCLSCTAMQGSDAKHSWFPTNSTRPIWRPDMGGIWLRNNYSRVLEVSSFTSVLQRCVSLRKGFSKGSLCLMLVFGGCTLQVPDS